MSIPATHFDMTGSHPGSHCYVCSPTPDRGEHRRRSPAGGRREVQPPCQGCRRVRLENGFWGASCPRRVLIALPRRSWSRAVMSGVPWSCCAAPRTTSRSSLRTCTQCLVRLLVRQGTRPARSSGDTMLTHGRSFPPRTRLNTFRSRVRGEHVGGGGSLEGATPRAKSTLGVAHPAPTRAARGRHAFGPVEERRGFGSRWSSLRAMSSVACVARAPRRRRARHSPGRRLPGSDCAEGRGGRECRRALRVAQPVYAVDRSASCRPADLRTSRSRTRQPVRVR